MIRSAAVRSVRSARPHRRLATAVVVAGLALGLSGCDTGSTAGDPGPAGAAASTTTTSASASASPAASRAPSTAGPTVSADPSAGGSASAEPPSVEWKTYRDPSHIVSFDLPKDWTAQLVPAPDAAPDRITVEVRDPSGDVLATFAAAKAGLGGACPPSSKRHYTVLASIPLNLPSDAEGKTAVTPRFTYRLIQGRNKFFASYGITDHAAGLDGTACLIYNTVTSARLGNYMFGDVLQFTSALDGTPGLRAFNTIAEAESYMRTSEFANLRKMITSLKIS